MARSTERNRLAKWRCQHQVQLPRQASGLPASLQPEQPGTPFQPDTLTLPRLAAQAPCANGEFVRKAEPSCWVLVLHGNTQGSRMVRPPRIFFFSSYPRVIFFFLPKTCLDFFPLDKCSSPQPTDGHLLVNYYIWAMVNWYGPINYDPMWLVEIKGNFIQGNWYSGNFLSPKGLHPKK